LLNTVSQGISGGSTRSLSQTSGRAWVLSPPLRLKRAAAFGRTAGGDWRQPGRRRQTSGDRTPSPVHARRAVCSPTGPWGGHRPVRRWCVPDSADHREPLMRLCFLSISPPVFSGSARDLHLLARVTSLWFVSGMELTHCPGQRSQTKHFVASPSVSQNSWRTMPSGKRPRTLLSGARI
jgi:hypothetical protein